MNNTKKIKIGFVNFAPLNYDVTTPLTKPLGGSESNLCFTCIELSKIGFDVTLYGLFDKTFKLKGVTHKDKSYLQNLEGEKLDFLVVQNIIANIPVINNPSNKTKIVLWQQLYVNQPASFPLEQESVRKTISHYVFVSKWQKNKFLEKYPLDKKNCVVIKNAISPFFEKMFPKSESILKYKKPILAYTSAPFRGLETLLIYLFPEIKRRFPEVTLKIYSSMKTYQKNDIEDHEYQYLYDLCQNTKGIKYYGSIPQKKLAQELKSVIALTYPNTWYETSSIAVMEAMAAGCKVITTALGALPETTAGFAHLIPVNDQYEKNCELFISKTVKVLTKLKNNDRLLGKELKKQVEFCNKNYLWQKRAKEWESFFKKAHVKIIKM